MCNGQRFFESGRGQSILGWPAKDRSTILCHTGQMDEDQLFLRPAKPPPAEISEHTYRIIDDLDCIKAQLSQLSRIPTRRELIHFGVWDRAWALRTRSDRGADVDGLGLGV
jgi:hypothetical protein